MAVVDRVQQNRITRILIFLDTLNMKYFKETYLQIAGQIGDPLFILKLFYINTI